MPFDMARPQSLADVLDLLSTRPDAATYHRDRISAVRRIAEMVGRAPSDLPCDAPGLRMYLDRIHPAQHGITARTLANIKSNVASALRCARAIPRNNPEASRSMPWEAFFSNAGAKHQIWSLSRLAAYCGYRGIEPEDVTDEVMAGFHSYLDARLLTKDPAKLCKRMAQTWNGIVSRNSLPLNLLAYERGDQYRCLPLSIYPVSLQTEIQTYLGRLAHHDLFDTEGPDKPLRPTSLRNVEAHLRQYLDGLVDAGEDPSSLVSLAHVVTSEKLKASFTAIVGRRRKNTVPVGCQNIAATLVAIARHHLKLAPPELDAIFAIRKRVSTNPKGMSDKNRERLAQFNDWENVVRLVSLPLVLMERAEKGGPTRNNALLAMYAAAISILLSCPMRAQNLSSLDLDRHVIAHRSGTHTFYTLRIPGSEVKNGEPIEVELKARASRLLHRYITRFRPLISSVPGTALFPKASDGQPRSAANFGSGLEALIARETGLKVHTHLFRHIAAKLFLQECPGHFEEVRRLLKHKKVQTTLDFYAEISNQWAHDRYDEVVLGKWGGRDE